MLPAPWSGFSAFRQVRGERKAPNPYLQEEPFTMSQQNDQPRYPRQQWKIDTDPLIEELINSNNRNLHGIDTMAWMLHIVGRLQGGRFDRRDLENIISSFLDQSRELLANGRSYCREALKALLLLKYAPAAGALTRSDWKDELARNRLQLETLIRHNRSMKPFRRPHDPLRLAQRESERSEHPYLWALHHRRSAQRSAFRTAPDRQVEQPSARGMSLERGEDHRLQPRQPLRHPRQLAHGALRGTHQHRLSGPTLAAGPMPPGAGSPLSARYG